ncbi:MAG: asparagine synthase (glutamine-hydrolyzing) [Calditrichota bacterium]
MCGFTGEYILEARSEVNCDLIERRASRLSHRGPDAAGNWFDRRVGLSHVRLKLIDPENGLQPMQSAKGTVLSYNGEIYNSTELRAELTAYGCTFRTRSDTEVLLAAYDTWGERAWERLNGMFAFALYDAAIDRIYLVRDPLGIKPLFYRLTERGVEFGSEISAWEDVAEGTVPLDPQGILHFLRFAHPALGGTTLFRELKILDPGSQLTADGDGIRVVRWHRTVAQPTSSSVDAATVRGQLRHLLHLSVGRQMFADAPVGVFLSGGIDSAILVGLLAQMSPEPPVTFTVALEGDDDELLPARAVARRWSCRHHELIVSSADFFAGMRELISIRQVPLSYPNEVLIYLLAKQAAQHVKAVLTGEGADELFGGYTRILSLLNLYANAKEAEQSGHSLLMKLLKKETPQCRFTNDGEFFADAYSWFRNEELNLLLTEAWRKELDRQRAGNFFEARLREWDDLPLMQRFHWLLEYAHLPNLLARLDGATMAASLEGRVPYTDRDLVRYVSALPSKLKFQTNQQDKPLLRSNFSDVVPLDVLNRSKKPFDASLEQLFSSRDGQRQLANIGRNPAMLEIFDRNLLDVWMVRNNGAGHGLASWLLVSLNMFLNRNIL